MDKSYLFCLLQSTACVTSRLGKMHVDVKISEREQSQNP